MAIAVIASTSQVFGALGGTTTGIDTTGANGLFVVLTYKKSAGANISDSKGNTFTILTKYEEPSADGAVVTYYVQNPTVGAGHTFTTTSQFCGVNVLAVSGCRTATTPLDQETGFTTGLAGGGTIQPGSLTPNVDGCIVLTGVNQQAAAGAPTVPTGYVTIGTYAIGLSFPGGAAYKIQTTAGAENPSWGVDPSANAEANLAVFMPPYIAPTTFPSFLNNFM